MRRTPEPELMNDPVQARAYAQADFEQPHSHCVELVQEKLGPLAEAQPRIIDLGCGPGDISFRLAAAYPGCEVIGVDGASQMLALAREEAARRGLSDRVHFAEALINDAQQGIAELPRIVPQIAPALVFSSSVLHHLEEPAQLWESMKRLGVSGTRAFVMDLMRPTSPERVDALVFRYAAEEPEILQRDFHASLHAAYTPEEIEAQLTAHGLASLEVEIISDRHWIAYGSL